jgi:uncharacterized protein DUF3365
MRRMYLFLVAMGAALAGPPLAGQAAREWPSYPIDQAPADLRPAVQHADLIVTSLQNAMLSELAREMDRGPADAIKVFHLATTAAAYRVAREQGIAAGRTSDRLRAPTNAPRPWAAPIVSRFAGRRAKDVDGFVVDLGDRVGVLRPITHRAVCSPCHGPENKLPSHVRDELKDRYPADRAVGFKEGDLRGWFWVEVPRKK